jgi:Na+/melibiose symporter-like transporter
VLAHSYAYSLTQSAIALLYSTDMEDLCDTNALERRPLLRDENDTYPSSEQHRGITEETLHYSTFTLSQKRGIIFLVSLAATFSPLSSFIYYPALHSIAKDIGVSLHMMDLTVTSYMIVSAIAPSIMGEMADQVGRRPIFLLMLVVYVIANIGLALQRSFAALILLPMLQSLGSSGRSRQV